VLNGPFIGSEALANGLVKKHQLRSQYCALFPDVYVPEGREQIGLQERARAAWLWSHREGVIAGVTASALHGAKWIDDTLPIELVWANARRPRGLHTYDMSLRINEYRDLAGMGVTTVARTGFDIARRSRFGDAVARLDALGNATGLRADEVRAVARRHRGARGLRQLEVVLDLYDAGAASPRETWLRLFLMRKGFPRPQTQIPVLSPDGERRYYLDMGWPELMLAVEYDGEQHRVDPEQYAYDIRRSEDIHELGWNRVRVVKKHKDGDVLARVERAWAASLRGDRQIS